MPPAERRSQSQDRDRIPDRNNDDVSDDEELKMSTRLYSILDIDMNVRLETHRIGVLAVVTDLGEGRQKQVTFRSDLVRLCNRNTSKKVLINQIFKLAVQLSTTVDEDTDAKLKELNDIADKLQPPTPIRLVKPE